VQAAQMENMAQLLQMLMSSSDSAPDTENNTENSAESESFESSEETNDDGDGFGGLFDNINLDMISKMGELFSHMNKPDRNSELLLALKGHLRDENRHKVDTAMKLSRMITMLPFLKDSGILNDLF